MTVWRIKLNSMRGDFDDWDAAKAYCRSVGVVGVGWGLPDVLPDGAPLEEVLEAVRGVPDWCPTGPRMIERLAQRVQKDDLIWTRDKLGGYWLGQITGSYRFDRSEDAGKWDLNNIRPCKWLRQPLRDFDVPGAVVRSFSGPGDTLRRVKGDVAIRATEMLWNRATTPDADWEPIAAEDVITDLLEPVDVEDVVLLMLQSDGWLLLPSSRMPDTPLYEAALRHRDGRLTVVSVKSGPGNPVSVRELAAAAGDAQAFAFSTADAYTEDPAAFSVEAIEREEIVRFMRCHPELLAPRVTRWLTASAAFESH
jgi:hypothetical protein